MSFPPVTVSAYNRGGPTINLPFRQFIHQKLIIVNTKASMLMINAGSL